jgi:hypothetical protein
MLPKTNVLQVLLTALCIWPRLRLAQKLVESNYPGASVPVHGAIAFGYHDCFLIVLKTCFFILELDERLYW